jgi:hypothetical protein
MSDVLSFAEIDSQQVELLPARTVLSLFAPGNATPGGHGAPGTGAGGSGGGPRVAYPSTGWVAWALGGPPRGVAPPVAPVATPDNQRMR